LRLAPLNHRCTPPHKIERDLIEDYARRKSWSAEEAEKWLAPVLNYDPGLARRAAAE
jgi:5-methyltetrahydrofolate--homocysteine methyltransferase